MPKSSEWRHSSFPRSHQREAACTLIAWLNMKRISIRPNANWNLILSCLSDMRLACYSGCYSGQVRQTLTLISMTSKEPVTNPVTIRCSKFNYIRFWYTHTHSDDFVAQKCMFKSIKSDNCTLLLILYLYLIGSEFNGSH